MKLTRILTYSRESGSFKTNKRSFRKFNQKVLIKVIQGLFKSKIQEHFRIW